MAPDVGRGNRFARSCERMSRCDREHRGNFPERPRPENAGGRGVAGNPEGAVDPTVGERVPAAAQYLGGQPQSRVRGMALAALGIELGNERPDHRQRNDRVDGDAQLGLPARGNALDPMFELAGGGQQQAPAAEQFPAGRGENGTMASAVEQPNVEVVLQLAHGVGDRRRNAVELRRGCGEAAFAIDGIENPQCVERKAHIRKY